MPFKFTGESHTFGAPRSAFSSFSTAASSTPGPADAETHSSVCGASSGASSNFAASPRSDRLFSSPAPSAFGAIAVGGVLQSFGASPLLGTHTSPWAREARSPAPSPEPHLLAKATAALATTASAISSSAGRPDPPEIVTDPLLGALHRAAEDRLTFFGGDAVLRDFTEHRLAVNREDFGMMAEQMLAFGKQHPQAMDLIRFLFEMTAKAEGMNTTAAKTPKKACDGTPGFDEHTLGALREQLVPIVHDKLVAMGLAPKEPSKEGFILNALARIICHVAVLCASKEVLVAALEEEEALVMGRDMSAVPELADWLWGELVQRRNATAVQKKKRYARQHQAEDQLADNAKRRAAMVKSGKYMAPGYFGDRFGGAEEDEEPCCAPRTNRSQPCMPSLTDGEAAQLKTWVSMKARNLLDNSKFNHRDCEVAADGLVNMLANDEGKDLRILKSTYVNDFKESQGLGYTNCTTFFNELFDALVNRSYATSDGITEAEHPFRFFDLPPELRTWVYREVLVPGIIKVTSCKHHSALAVEAGLTLDLLTTCKQLHYEAKNVVFENRFLVDAHTCSMPMWMFPTQQLPHHILPQMTSMTLYLAVEAANGDWKQLQAMTGLKHLTVCFHETKHITPAQERMVMENLLRSVPAHCSIDFGPETLPDIEYYMKKLDDMDAKRVRWEPQDAASLVQVAREAEKSIVKGCNSGKSGLYYFDGSGKVVHV